MVTLRIAQAQINTTVGNFSGNAEKIIQAISSAREQNADIVTFPELSICGYPPEDLLLKRSFLRDNKEILHHIKEHTEDMAAIVGYADSHDGKVYNAAALLHNGELIATYHKIELPNYGVFDEKRYFEKGSDHPIFEIGQIRFTITICEDIWIDGGISEKIAAAANADIVFNISASPFHAGKTDMRLHVADRFVRNTGSCLFFNNLVGGQDELVFDGGTFVVDTEGRVVSRAARFREEMLITDIEIPTGRSSSKDRKPEQAETTLVSLNMRPRAQKEKVETRIAEKSTKLDEIYEALILGTRDYVRKNGFKKVLIGLSGGIDSALTAAIAVDALGEENVVGVTMPSQYTSNETFTDAERLAKNLHIELITAPIKEIYQSYLEAGKAILGTTKHGIAHENMQARIRGNILMAVSNQFGWLVLTTGNKSEIAVGYCTLYGDMAGGFAVIKDVPKTLVFELSKHLNERKGKEIIPETTIKRPPSAELRPDQKDEDSLPPYSILDPILEAYVEKDESALEIINKGFDPETVYKVLKLVDLNEYKRRQAPPGVKITPRAFGRDRRLPITNTYLRSAP